MASDEDYETTEIKNEATPLVSSTSTASEDSRTTRKWIIVSIAVVVIVLALPWSIKAAGIKFQPDYWNSSKSSTNPTTFETSGIGTQDIPYREWCELYVIDSGDDDDDDEATTKTTIKSARIIQTSMGDPSQQWSLLPCYKTTSTGEDVLNAYGSPDAVMGVNFSNVAHPGPSSAILGFGGAFTEASALNYETLSEKGKETVMELLFGRSGLGYAMGRVHINSCDFSVKSYSFDDTVDDFDLDDFDVGVHHDAQSGMVDMALRATSVFRDGWSSSSSSSTTDNDVNNPPPLDDGELRLFASPWSPPAWMKAPTWADPDNATHALEMTGSAQPVCILDGVGTESKYAAAWALYFSKWLTAYSDLGLPMWAITVQNEPEFPAPWEACSYTAELESEFVANHLGPQLRSDHPDVKIFIFDHNKDHVNSWVTTMLNESSPSAEYISGTAYHWYAGGMDRLLDGALGAANMHRLQHHLETYGIRDDHFVLGSEACHCPSTGYACGDISVYWSRAERYAHTILADLAAGSNGWVEWNLILDQIGGPNHLGNLCEAPILAAPHRASDANPFMSHLPPFEYHGPDAPIDKNGDVTIGDGRTREELNAIGFPAKYLDAGVVVQPLYYYMGHISKYVRPGSRSVVGLVQQSIPGNGRIFRPANADVMGGGENGLARDGIEITLWPCEGSTRQQFNWNSEYRGHIEVFGHDWLGNPTKSCIGKEVDVDFFGMKLTSCEDKYDEAGEFDMIPIGGDQHGRYHIKLLNHPTNSNKTDSDDGGDDDNNKEVCLIILELQNDGGAYGPRGGAQVALGDCEEEPAKWILDPVFGEAASLFFGDDGEVCMTTGWPFLQMGAFLTPNGESTKTMVVLNEGVDPANYAIRDDDDDGGNENKIVLTGSIPPRSIQTILLD